LFLIIVINPTNTTFKKLFSKYQPQKTINTNENKPILGAGSIVGSLERLLMGVLISIDQFSAAGLIMTAKSIARYDLISKNPQFAEYYLIGTLYSILMTVILYIILFNLWKTAYSNIICSIGQDCKLLGSFLIFLDFSLENWKFNCSEYNGLFEKLHIIIRSVSLFQKFHIESKIHSLRPWNLQSQKTKNLNMILINIAIFHT